MSSNISIALLLSASLLLLPTAAADITDAPDADDAPTDPLRKLPACAGMENPAPGINCIGATKDCIGMSTIDGCTGAGLD